ncbi:glycoside hydrolase family 30 protein [candidate division KSB1 bacterium]|nr:glycosyl hydrolase [bacterium]NUM67742.1 glycoside hydrolase family 30 protein [candidate division KSB1 bacterium]
MLPFTKQLTALCLTLIVSFSTYAAAQALDGPQDVNASAARQWSKAEVYVTAKATNDRITKKEPLTFLPLEQPDEHTPTIILDKDKTFQTLVGIGGALTDASAETFYKLPAKQQQEILTAFFDKAQGIGFTLCRTNIHSCDFSSSSYTYAEIPGDSSLQHFSIAPDLKYKIPFIKAAFAQAGAEFKLFASPWSPPAWMKTNNNMLQGGKLRPEYNQTWANYFVRFVQEFEKAGVPIWGLTVQNEPMAVQTWESCIFTATEERDFVKYHLGPALERAGLSRLKLMIWDHNRGIMYQRAKVVYDDPVASKYVWGAGFHWYVGDHFDNVRLVHDAYPDKELVFTEGTEANFDANKVKDWQWGEFFGKSIIMDLNNWASGWVAWNVILDERGGPNHVGNFCMAPIICNTKTGELTYMNSFYYLGHFSKFLRPGAKRIICSSNHDDLLATAFLNPDGKIAVVVMNQTEKDIAFHAWIENQAVKTNSPAHSIVTLVL